MDVPHKSRHLTADLLYDFLKGILSPGRRARVERHLAACAPCQEIAERGRVLMEWLGNWSLDSQNLSLGRVLLRNALARAAKARGPKGRRLQDWRKSEAPRFAALLTLKWERKRSQTRAEIGRLDSLAKEEPGPEMVWRAGTQETGGKRKEKGRDSAAGQTASVAEIEPRGKSQLLFRYHAVARHTRAPLVLLMSCRDREKAVFQILKKKGKQQGWWETRFCKLEPGPYLLAVEPPSVSAPFQF